MPEFISPMNGQIIHSDFSDGSEDRCKECEASYAKGVEEGRKPLIEALKNLIKSAARLEGKVQFSMDHSIRACSHQEFLSQDREDWASYAMAKTAAESLLAAPKSVWGKE